ncbi:hypothetical protein NQZ68_010591 [Dissostichus eleginoides]|nr:hypothetical protein NQZ68_010591 [Dissostichus eleginoides]
MELRQRPVPIPKGPVSNIIGPTRWLSSSPLRTRPTEIPQCRYLLKALRVEVKGYVQDPLFTLAVFRSSHQAAPSYWLASRTAQFLPRDQA